MVVYSGPWVVTRGGAGGLALCIWVVRGVRMTKTHTFFRAGRLVDAGRRDYDVTRVFSESLSYDC